jgi:hypothetical protein
MKIFISTVLILATASCCLSGLAYAAPTPPTLHITLDPMLEQKLDQLVGPNPLSEQVRVYSYYTSSLATGLASTGPMLNKASPTFKAWDSLVEVLNDPNQYGYIGYKSFDHVEFMALMSHSTPVSCESPKLTSPTPSTVNAYVAYDDSAPYKCKITLDA